jgi:hypothetical protein
MRLCPDLGSSSRGADRILLEIVEKRCVEAGRGLGLQKLGRLTVVENDLVRGVHHHHRERDVGQDRRQLLRLEGEFRRALRHRVGRVERRRREAFGHRRRRGREIAQIPCGGQVQIPRDAAVRPRAKIGGQTFDGLRDILVEEKPYAGRQPQDAEPPHDSRRDEGRARGPAGLAVAQKQSRGGHRDRAQPQRHEEEKNPCAEAQAFHLRPARRPPGRPGLRHESAASRHWRPARRP